MLTALICFDSNSAGWKLSMARCYFNSQSHLWDVVISTCSWLIIVDGNAGEHHTVDDCDVSSSSPTFMLDSAALQKALRPLQQQQHDIAEQMTVLNSRLSTLQSDVSHHSASGLLGPGLLNGNDIFILAAMLLLQLLMLWWLVRPGFIAEQETHSQ